MKKHLLKTAKEEEVVNVTTKSEHILSWSTFSNLQTTILEALKILKCTGR